MQLLFEIIMGGGLLLALGLMVLDSCLRNWLALRTRSQKDHPAPVSSTSEAPRADAPAGQKPPRLSQANLTTRRLPAAALAGQQK